MGVRSPASRSVGWILLREGRKGRKKESAKALPGKQRGSSEGMARCGLLGQIERIRTFLGSALGLESGRLISHLGSASRCSYEAARSWASCSS